MMSISDLGVRDDAIDWYFGGRRLCPACTLWWNWNLR